MTEDKRVSWYPVGLHKKDYLYYDIMKMLSMSYWFAGDFTSTQIPPLKDCLNSPASEHMSEFELQGFLERYPR